MNDKKVCHICGTRRSELEMECITMQDTQRWFCNPTRDPECIRSQGRRYSWFAGWRREHGLEPFDQAPGSPVIYTTTEDGLTERYALTDGVSLDFREDACGQVWVSVHKS